MGTASTALVILWVSNAAILALACAVAAVAALSVYLLLLAVASFHRPAERPQLCSARTRFAILIPAHDEEPVIGRLLASVDTLDYPRERIEVHVIADHCSDRTADIARGLGATVHERGDPVPRGKSRSLNWLIRRLLAREPHRHPDAFLVLDADSTISRNFLRVMDACLDAGATCAQSTVEAENTGTGGIAPLRGLAYALISQVRPLGRSSLGLSAGLRGNGLCMTSACAERFPWDADSLTEDYDQHARLLLAGLRVAYAPRAIVHTQLPSSLDAARTQSARWERGRLDAMRRHVPALLRHGLLRRSWLSIDGAMELLIPPFSILVGFTLALLALSLLSGNVALIALAGIALLAQALHALRGLALVAARTPQIYRALLFVPAFLIWRVCLYSMVLLRRGRVEWVRTIRTPLD
jgi:cellulose synthase/poly-beta-1,6-N-acetylglucosamine synthase-like glycosyltransferase